MDQEEVSLRVSSQFPKYRLNQLSGKDRTFSSAQLRSNTNTVFSLEDDAKGSLKVGFSPPQRPCGLSMI